MLKDKKPYKHLKTGNIYYSLGTCINCTNKDDGKEMMIYTNEKQIFCRELDEFNVKFSPIE